jgi:3-oxoacyl-[acyl-carrier-protein] synthase-3
MQPKQHVYINGVGKHLPGNPVGNDAIENHLGRIYGKASPLKSFVLRQNQIKTRHYAIDDKGQPFSTNAQMAAEAVKDAISHSQCQLSDISYLASATTQGDLLVPGMTCQVQNHLGCKNVEIANFQSVCGSSMMALKNAYLNVACGESNVAAVCASEFSSRWFQPGFYEAAYSEAEYEKPPMETEFLRFTLSDGAGAAILEPRPNKQGRSMKIEWIKQRSYADRFAPCMYAGSSNNYETLPWSMYNSPKEALQSGAVLLRQDFDLLYKLFPVWVGYYMELVEEGLITPEKIDHFLAHYSAHSLRKEMTKLLEKTNAMIEESKWFTNLYEKGNTGSASILVMLEELMNEQELNPGEQVLCFVPESGQCLIAFMLLTVV